MCLRPVQSLHSNFVIRSIPQATFHSFLVFIPFTSPASPACRSANPSHRQGTPQEKPSLTSTPQIPPHVISGLGLYYIRVPHLNHASLEKIHPLKIIFFTRKALNTLHSFHHNLFRSGSSRPFLPPPHKIIQCFIFCELSTPKGILI